MEVRTHPSNSQVPRGTGGEGWGMGAEIVFQLQKAGVGVGALSHATRFQFNYWQTGKLQ